MFSNFNPCSDSIKVINTLVFPQFDGPAMMQRMELGNNSLCFFFFDIPLNVDSSTFLTGMLIDCLMKRIISRTVIKNRLQPVFNLVIPETFTCKQCSMDVQGEKKCKRTTRKKKKKSIKCCLNNRVKRFGKGLIDRIIDKIPFELHVPNYQYCGPGTHLKERLNRGDPGINPLDAACKTHDIAYDKNKESSERSKADKILQKEALKRVFAKNASFGERAVALGVAAAMKVKRKISGKGFQNRKRSKAKKKSHRKKRKPISFSYLIKSARVAIKKSRPDDIGSAIKIATTSAKRSKSGKHILPPRIIKLPSITGGILPLIPIFAGLGALGSIIGSSAGIANAINQTRKGQKELEESRRHNQRMESIAIGNKVGQGFYLQRAKRGGGFYLTRSKNH